MNNSNILTIDNVPEEMIANIRSTFELNPDIQQLNANIFLARRGGKFAEAMAMMKKKDDLFAKIVQLYIDESNKQKGKVLLGTLDFSQEQRDRINAILISMYMLTDILDTCIRDVNDIIHSVDKSVALDDFDEMSSTFRMAAEKLKHFQEQNHYMDDLRWGDECDNMYSMLTKKAASIMRKANSKRWGENKKKMMSA